MMRTTHKSGSGTIRWKDGNKPVSKNSNKQWIHASDTMTQGSLIYVVRFFGRCEVDRPKGTDTVKHAIRKMKMHYSMKKCEGKKPDKVELIISVDGVSLHDIKSKATLHHYPLHRISYCADDKSDKKMVTFIAREGSSEQHCCYVFSSDKCAEEIALTVGQAFDLAYHKFLESYGKEAELRKHVLQLQQKINKLEEDNKLLQLRVKEMERDMERPDLQQYLRRKPESVPERASRPLTIGFDGDQSYLTNGQRSINSPSSREPTVGRRLENLCMADDYPTKLRSISMGSSNVPALISPPPRNPRSGQIHSHSSASNIPSMTSLSPQPITNQDLLTSLFGPATDPFGMGSFQPADYDEMQSAFSRGLALDSDDFNLEDLDPLFCK